MFRKFFLLLLLITFIFNCKSSLYKAVIADFKGNALYVREVIDKLNELPADRKKNIKNSDDYYRFVRKLALEKIILYKIEDEKFHLEENNLKKIERIKKETAYDILVRKNVDSKIFVVEVDFKKYKKRYSLFQIVKRTDELDENKIKESRILLERLAIDIKNIDDFKKMATKYSDDVTATDSGYVGKIRLDVMEESIDHEMVKLKPGKISDIVESSTGLHLLFVENIEEVRDEDLLKDSEIYDLILKSKRDKAEESWHQKLLKLSIIDHEAMKEKKYDDKVIASYKDEKITRGDLFKKVDSFSQDNFPAPNNDEIYNFLTNMVLNIILKDKSLDPSITNSKDYKERLEREKDFLLINNYIEKNINDIAVSDNEISMFYKENLRKLFTFKNDDGTDYIQPMDEVRDFIVDKIKPSRIKESRYELYRKLVSESNLTINKEIIDEIINL